MRILLMGDNFFTEYELCQELKTAGFIIDCISYDERLLETSRFYDYDIIIFNVDNPTQNIFSVIKEIRLAGSKTPIIIVSKQNDTHTKVQALTAGADDYVVAPFDRAELIARCKTILRRMKGYSESIIHIDNLQLNLDTHEVFVNGNPVHLTGKEYSVLELLILRRGMLLSKTTFLNHLYGGSVDEPDVKIIDVFVCKLRKKLQQAGAGDIIATLWGRGYILRKPTRTEEVNDKSKYEKVY